MRHQMLAVSRLAAALSAHAADIGTRYFPETP